METNALYRQMLVIWKKIAPISTALIIVVVYVSASIVSHGRLAPPSDFFGLPGWAFGIGVIAFALLVYFLGRRMGLKDRNSN